MTVPIQLVLYLSVGAIGPTVAWLLVRSLDFVSVLADWSLYQIVLANLLTWYALGRLRSYARARLLSYVLPVNVITFGTVLGLNALARTGFSWTLLLPCAFATLAVSYLVTARIRHANPNLRHYIVPGGDIGSILGRQGFLQLGSADELNDLIARKLVTGSVVADLHDEKAPEWERAIARAALSGVPVYHYRLIEEELTGEVRINHLRENDLGSLIPNLPYRTVKRAIDIAGAMVLMPVLLPLMAIIALLIRMDGAGPIIFRQERLGYRGENFTMVKFRTMRERVVSDHDDARRDDAITRDSDDRITRVGGFLRKTRLDELPQVWNILKGDMSWIGPRPEARALADWYEAEIPFYAYRHIVRPGITGWAQVNQGHVAGIDDVHTKLRFDFYYVKNLSLWLDILIALKTLRVIVSGIGAK
ncbi:sugar transferase [Parerythrobacter aurantius]|uniref:sugar transferase n=1 Tax=Parerythrobacter aurantius TaxID=3127706 RepID=UPI00325117BF